MPSATMTSKGQITVPKVIRDALKVGPGDRLGFRLGNDGRVEVVAETLDVRSLFGMLDKYARTEGPLRVEEIDDVIADAVVEEYERSIR